VDGFSHGYCWFGRECVFVAKSVSQCSSKRDDKETIDQPMKKTLSWLITESKNLKPADFSSFMPSQNTKLNENFFWNL
jgi:hypothetical protein